MAYDVSKLSKLADLKLLAQKLEADYATKKSVTDLSKRVDDLVTAGGEPNVITAIKVNGTAATVTDKAVDIAVPTKVSDITNDSKFQTETQVTDAINAKIAAVYKPGGSCAFADLPELSEANLGLIFNITDKFTTTADFIEGEGQKYPTGTNVGIVQSGDAYKYDVMSGVTDLSAYETSAQTQTKLDGKVDKADGKVLSSNDFTDDLKAKLEGVPAVATTEEVQEMLNEVFGTTPTSAA